MAAGAPAGGTGDATALNGATNGAPLPDIEVAPGVRSIPLKVLAAAADTELLVQLSTGYLYRGWLVAADADMNLDLRDATVTCVHRPSYLQRSARVFLRSGTIVSIVMEPRLEADVKEKGRQMGKWIRKTREIAKKAKAKLAPKGRAGATKKQKPPAA